MAVISEAAIRELANLRYDGAAIVSCYLDVDGRRLVRQQDVELELEGAMRAARRRAGADRAVEDDLRRIEAFVRGGFDRGSTRGLAIFACGGADLWKVIELPKPVRTSVVVNHAPAVGQLESMVQEHEAVAVLLADKQRAQLLLFELGELVDRSELLDELPRDYDSRGDRERGTPEHHRDELAHQHLRHAARAAFELWQAHGFHHLVIGASDVIAGELERDLHPYLRERLRGRVPVAIGASEAEILAAAETVEGQVERDREAALVARLKEAAATGGRATAGLAPTLAALGARRVERLVVSKGFAQEGWRSSGSGALAVVGPKHPDTGDVMERVPDVVEEAIDEALHQGVPVTICVADADLDVLGRIGALLRY